MKKQTLFGKIIAVALVAVLGSAVAFGKKKED